MKMIKENKALRIGVDVDGVLRDLMTGIDNVFKTHYPETFIGGIVYNYDFPQINMPLDEKKQIIFHKYAEEIFLNTKPYPGTVSHFNYLKRWAREHGFKLACATAQEPHIIHLTYLWLGKHNFVFDELHVTKDKGSIGLDYLIDDAPDNYTNWLENGNPEENFFLMDRDLNKQVPATNRITRISDAIKIIKQQKENNYGRIKIRND